MDQEKLVQQLQNMAPVEGLQLVGERYGSNARLSSSLGIEDQVLTYWIATHHIPIHIFTIDTGRLFQETYDVLDLTRRKFDIDIQVFFPERNAVEELVNTKGPNSFFASIENRKECCYIRKVEPLGRALAGADVWITGLRSDQSHNRQQMQVAEWDEQRRLIKYNPLLHWSMNEVEKEVNAHHIPVNTLHRKGYPSIGCAPCTRAILPGEDARAGRWWWESSAKECGLHQTK